MLCTRVHSVQKWRDPEFTFTEGTYNITWRCFISSAVSRVREPDLNYRRYFVKFFARTKVMLKMRAISYPFTGVCDAKGETRRKGNKN